MPLCERGGTFGSFAARPQGLRASIAAFRRSTACAAMLLAGRHDMALEGGELLRPDFDNPTHAVEHTDAL
jgi:hypothetical protein